MSNTGNSVPSVLFVCLGNICRSPTAEAVFRHKAAEKGLNAKIDSAGTHGYHVGEQPDKRSQEAGVARGYSFSAIRCRQVDVRDFNEFDHILAMDQSNVDNLVNMAPEAYTARISLFLEFAAGVNDSEVPDPYYGGRNGFERVLDLVEQASDGLIEELQAPK